MALGLGLGIPFSKGGGAAPFDYTEDLALEYSRSGLDLLETFSGDSLDAKILPVAAFCDSTHYMLLATADFASGVNAASGGYIEARVYVDASVTMSYIFGSADQLTTTKYFTIRNYQGKPQIRTNTNAIYADDALSTGWHIIKFASVLAGGVHYEITIDGETVLTEGAGFTVALGNNNGQWIGDIADRDNISIGVLRTSAYNYSTAAYIDYVDFNGTNKWILSGTYTHEWDIIGGVHMPWPTLAQKIYLYGAGQHLLNIGYSVFFKVDTYIIVPYDSTGTPFSAIAINTELGGGWSLIGDYSGAVDGIPLSYLLPARIGFNETSDADSRLEIFDRSNTTRMEDLTRAAGDYDATSLATKSRFDASIICYIDILETHYKTGYKHRIFPINDDLDTPIKVTGFLVYNTERT